MGTTLLSTSTFTTSASNTSTVLTSRTELMATKSVSTTLSSTTWTSTASLVSSSRALASTTSTTSTLRHTSTSSTLTSRSMTFPALAGSRSPGLTHSAEHSSERGQPTGKAALLRPWPRLTAAPTNSRVISTVSTEAPGSTQLSVPLTMPPPGGPLLAPSPKQFDCWDGMQAAGSWSQAKALWCCDRKQIGCAGAKAPPQTQNFDCWAGLGEATRLWSPNKVDWCCVHQQLGCRSLGELEAPPAVGAEGEPDLQVKFVHPPQEEEPSRAHSIRNPGSVGRQTAVVVAVVVAAACGCLALVLALGRLFCWNLKGRHYMPLRDLSLGPLPSRWDSKTRSLCRGIPG